MKRNNAWSLSRNYCWLARVSLILGIAAIAGCASLQQAQQYVQEKLHSGKKSREQMLSAEGKLITLDELNQLTHGFADRYMTYMGAACEAIAKDNPSTGQRLLAHQVRLVQVSSIYDIVTNADAFTQLLDLTLVVTLSSQKWIDEDWAEEWFGERGQYLIAASRRAREDIWKVAARVMKPDQLEQLDYLIWDWRHKNPDVQMVAYVRFDDFAESRGKSEVADVKSGGGLLAPVGEAKKAVDEVRLLGERAFYFSKRMPLLLTWQVETAVDGVMENPRIAAVTDSVSSVSQSVNRATLAVERIPGDISKERAAIFRALQGKDGALNVAFNQYRGAVHDTNELAGTVDGILQQAQDTSKALNTTIETVDKVFLQPGKNQPKAANSKPFDIESYTQSALAVSNAIREVDHLLADTGNLLGSPRLDQPIQKINAVAAERVEQVTHDGIRILNAAFWRGAVLIVLFFVMLGLYRLFASLIAPRSSPPSSKL